MINFGCLSVDFFSISLTDVRERLHDYYLNGKKFRTCYEFGASCIGSYVKIDSYDNTKKNLATIVLYLIEKRIFSIVQPTDNDYNFYFVLTTDYSNCYIFLDKKFYGLNEGTIVQFEEILPSHCFYLTYNLLK